MHDAQSDYTGITGRANYFGDSKDVRQFTIWSRIADIQPMTYVYVPRFRMERDRFLSAVCKGARELDNGFMVAMTKWSTKITDEGTVKEA